MELSGGQWQRLALARALIRRAPVLILDEPTSALDPWAEARWLEGLRGLTRGRTVLLITHRLTAAALADRIHVMEGGQVLESGSHAELLRRGGPYAAAWEAAGSAVRGWPGPGNVGVGPRPPDPGRRLGPSCR